MKQGWFDAILWGLRQHRLALVGVDGEQLTPQQLNTVKNKQKRQRKQLRAKGGKAC